MGNPKLNQIIAIEKGVKGRQQKILTRLHRLSGQPALFSGLTKIYTPKDEENGERFPDERQRVQTRVEEVLAEAGDILTELFDVEATKDFGNCVAKADVVLDDGTTLVEDVPTTYLLFLEKQLNDIHTFVSELPELDEAYHWERDPETGLRRTSPLETVKTRKVQRPLVLYPATDKHPAQTQLITEDEVIGTWETTRLSGAVSASRKKELLGRVVRLQKAVKTAREEANNTEIERKEVGRSIINYLFG